MSLIRAQRYVRSVDLIDVDDLRNQGIRCVLLDRDNTLVPRDATSAPPEVEVWLARLRQAGIAVCMVSNNFHTKEVCASAKELNCEVVHHAMKPAPIAIWHALLRCGVTPEQTMLIGDQLFTDMIAGNLAGVQTVLVRPQSVTDLWYTQLFRKVEHLLLRGAVYEGE